ncbi:Fic family protein [Streptomyces albus]|uniref:Fic family protein n=1 Tax=Streptomyces albus TaxID=1888 RepID=UPI0004C6A03E|nr:Fic family protein [Streptomyces albus]
MLFATPALTSDDRRVIEEIEAFRTEFRHRLAQPRRWEGQLRRSLTAAAVRGSTHIEGYTISADEAETLIAGGDISPETDEATRNAVIGYRDALTYVQHAADFRIFSWDHTLFSALHFMMTRAADKEVRSGEYRSSGVWVSGGPNRPPVYTAPDPEQVPALMDELIRWLAEGDLDAPALVRASMAHFNLVSIHPWCDGNGRMSRAVHTLVLARDGVLAPEFSSIEEWLGADEFNTREYYAALREVRTSWQPERDTASWIRFCLTAHHLQAQEVQRRFEAAARLWFRLERLAEKHRLDERTVSALYAAAQGHLRRTTYQTEETLTRDQALADLRRLRGLGLIEPVGHARTQRYIGGQVLRGLRGEVHAEVHADLYREPYDRP